MHIITRAEWGARYPNGFGARPLPATQAWLHHSVTIAPDLVPPFDDDYAAIRELEAIGQSRFGGGISYTRLFTPAGLIFEGHGIGRVGSHTANRNSVAVGYCLVGNYDTAEPSEAQLRAVAWCLQHDHTNGWLDQARLDGGHRDLKATACPGRHAYAAIPDINRLAAGPPIGDDDHEEDAMFQSIELEPTDDDEQREVTIALPWQGGSGGATSVYAMVCAGAGGMTLHVAHWQRQQGATGVEPGIRMVADGTRVPARGRTAGVKAQPGVHALILSYTATLGGSVVIEAAR